jgi:hypothetical protein
VSRSDQDSLAKKILAAWINRSQKNGTPQLTCNNNFAEVIDKILPQDKTLSSMNVLLREWILLAKEESTSWSMMFQSIC